MSESILTKNALYKRTEFSLLVIILALFVACSVGTETFFSAYNITNVMRQCSITGVLAISATLIIITGGIDLSCGAICGMSGLIMALCMTRTDMPIPAAAALALLAGVACGLINGIVIYEFRVPPFIATLGMMTIIRGLIKVISEAKTIAGLPKEFSSFSNEFILGIPKMAWVWVGVIVFALLLLKFTRFGRNLYVIGSGREVARLSGINLRLNIYSVYTLAGLLCGIAGILLTARINSAVPTGGAGYEMSAIAATVIGGASLAGAKGTAIGTALGTILMTLIENGGIQFGIDPFIMEISVGVLIIIAVVIDMAGNKKG